MQQWGLILPLILNTNKVPHRSGRACSVIVHFYGTITEGNRTHIVQLYKKRDAEGEIRHPNKIPFIFLFSSQQLNTNRKTPDVCVTTFKLKVCLILVFLFSPPFHDNTHTCQSADKGLITRWKRQCYACCCTIVIEAQHVYAPLCFLFFWKVLWHTSQLLATRVNSSGRALPCNFFFSFP